MIVTSALHIYLLTTREHLNFRRALVHGLGSTIAFCLALLVFWPVAALLSYHLRVCSYFQIVVFKMLTCLFLVAAFEYYYY